MEALPEAYDERISFLYSTIESGLEKLLSVARKKDVLQAPFGHPAPFTPYVAADAGPGGPDSADDALEPQFSYDYGFNALAFLSDIVRQAHPESVVARKLERLELFHELKRRTEFAKQQCCSATSLREDAALAAAGIAGPVVTAPLSPNALLVVVRPRCTGQLVVHVSSSPDFSTEFQSLKEPVTDVSSSCKVSVNDLSPAKQYYIRCCVEDEAIEKAGATAAEGSDGLDDLDLDGRGGADSVVPEKDSGGEEHTADCFLQGPQGGVFGRASCWTLPAETADDNGVGEDATSSSRPGSAISESYATTTDQGPSYSPMFSLFLVGGMDTALTKHHTRKAAGDSLSWPALQLGEAFDINCPIFSPPAGQLAADVWPPLSENEAPIEEPPRPLFSCLLGDVMPPTCAGELTVATGATASESDQKSKALFSLFKNTKLFSDPKSVLRNSGIFLAWNDASVGADVALKSEESTYKQWAHHKRKHEKRLAAEKGGKDKASSRKASVAISAPPPLQRPPITPALNTLVENFPVLSEDEETRKLYKSVPMGPHIELLILDTRRGYLGRSQSKWLKHRLITSLATWKVILSGASFGRVDVEIDQGTPTSGDNQGDVDGNAAVEVSTEGEDAVEAANETTSKRLGKSVSITRLDDLDENGRFKDSIQALLHSLQKDAPVPEEYPPDMSSVAAGGSISSQGGSVDKSLSVAPSATGQLESSPEGPSILNELPVTDTRPWPERFAEMLQAQGGNESCDTFAVASGIVLLTGNGSRTLEVSGNTSLLPTHSSASNRNENDRRGVPSLDSCYVALYNPKDVGSVAYCAEVNVAGHDSVPGFEPALDHSMGSYCVYPPSPCPDDTTSKRDIVCVLHTTARNGPRIAPELVVRLADAEKGEVLYEASFSVPSVGQLPKSRSVDNVTPIPVS